MHQQIVGGHAGLACVEKFSKDNPLCCQLAIGRSVHDTGAFPTQFQGDWGQMCGRFLHHKLPNRYASREKDVIKLLFQQGGIGLAPTLYHGHIFRRKTSTEQFFDFLRYMGRIGRGLENHGISCS